MIFISHTSGSTCYQTTIQLPSIFPHHPCIALSKVLKQKASMKFQRKSLKVPPPLATIQRLWHFKCTIKHCNQVQHMIMTLFPLAMQTKPWGI